MPDTTERLDVLDRLNPPDLWDEIREREPRRAPVRSERPAQRAIVIATVMALMVGAIGFAVYAFRDRRPQPATPLPAGPTNGEIWVRIGGGDGASFVYSVEPDGSAQTLLFGDGRDPNEPPDTVDPAAVGEDYAWSPDGSRVAFVNYTDDDPTAPLGKDYDVFVMNPDGSGLTRLTHDRAVDSSPSWSPDGSKIVFASDQAARTAKTCTPSHGPGSVHPLFCSSQLYVIGADGAGEARLTPDLADASQPAWSPDGRFVAFVVHGASRDGDCVCVMNADGTGSRRSVAGSGAHPEWSPDSAAIAFLSTSVGGSNVQLVNTDGSDLHELVPTGLFDVASFAWSPDGSQIAFSGSGRGGTDVAQIWLVPASGGDPTQVSNFEHVDAGSLAWRPAPPR